MKGLVPANWLPVPRFGRGLHRRKPRTTPDHSLFVRHWCVQEGEGRSPDRTWQ